MPQIDPQQAIDFMTPALRNPKVKLFVLNSFRVGELRGARDLSAFVELVDDLGVKAKVIRHTADEGRHQYILAKRMIELGGTGALRPVAKEFNFLEQLAEAGRVAQGGRRDIEGKIAAGAPIANRDLVGFAVGAQRIERDALGFLQIVWQSCGVDLGTRRVIEDIAADEEYHVRYLTELIKQFQDEGFAEDVRSQQAIVDRINEETGAAMDARMAEQFARLMAEA
jgi:bacterioferritin (cytochrome b1)